MKEVSCKTSQAFVVSRFLKMTTRPDTFLYQSDYYLYLVWSAFIMIVSHFSNVYCENTSSDIAIWI